MFPKLRKFSSISLIAVFLFGGLTFPAYGLDMGTIFDKMKTDDDKRWFKIGLGLRNFLWSGCYGARHVLG